MELFNASKIIFTIINFGILFFILKHYLFNKVNQTLDERQGIIMKELNDAKQSQQDAQKSKEEHEKMLDQLKVDSKKMMEDYKARAEEMSKEILDGAKSEAQLIMDRARTEINREKDKALYELKLQAVDLAVALSTKALAEVVDENTHKKLIEDFLLKVGS